MSSALEKRFTKRLAKNQWHTYKDDSTGRVVTNAYESELPFIEKATGLKCEIVRTFGAIKGKGKAVAIGPAAHQATKEPSK